MDDNNFVTVAKDYLMNLEQKADEFVCLDALKARLLYERYKKLIEDIDSLLTDRPNVNVMTYEEAVERIRKPETQYDAEEVAKDINRRVDMVKKEWNARHIEDEPSDYCKKRNCVWWSRSLRICLAERNGLVCKYKSGKE